jgi:hypothetical protein
MPRRFIYIGIVQFNTGRHNTDKMADHGTVSIFMKKGITVDKEEDVLITCKGEPTLIDVQDGHGRY